MDEKAFEVQLLKLATEALVGHKITGVRFLSTDETEEDFGWDERPFVITLENGVEIVASMDPEGNGPGALFVNVVGLEIIGAMPL